MEKAENSLSAKTKLHKVLSAVKVDPPTRAIAEKQNMKVGSVVLVHNEKPLKGQPKFVPARVISPENDSVKVPKLTHSGANDNSKEEGVVEEKMIEAFNKRFHDHLRKQFLSAKDKQLAQKRAGKGVLVLTPVGQVVVSTQYIGRKREREGRLKAFSIDGAALMSEALDILGADF